MSAVSGGWGGGGGGIERKCAFVHACASTCVCVWGGGGWGGGGGGCVRVCVRVRARV